MSRTKVIVSGEPDAIARMLRWSSRPETPVQVTLDPHTLAMLTADLSDRGYEVIEDTRISRKLLLELAPGDLGRLRILATTDFSDVLAAARRAVHTQLDYLIAEPACPIHHVAPPAPPPTPMVGLPEAGPRAST